MTPMRLAHSLPLQLKLCRLYATFGNHRIYQLQSAACRNRKCTECGMTAFGRNRLSAESANLSTFGTKTETEIWSTFKRQYSSLSATFVVSACQFLTNFVGFS